MVTAEQVGAYELKISGQLENVQRVLQKMAKSEENLSRFGRGVPLNKNEIKRQLKQIEHFLDGIHGEIEQLKSNL